MQPKAILLDLDDTIIAYEQGIDLDACWMKVCHTHLAETDANRMSEIVGLIKKHAKEYWSDADRHRIGRLDLPKARTEIVHSVLKQISFDDSELAGRIAVDYGLVRDELAFLHPGALEAIAYIKSMGIKLALITNGASSAQRGKINRFELADYFDHIYIEEEFGVGKPDPSIYLHAANQLGAAPEETWMVGDNYQWEVIAPQQIGIKGVWINPKGMDTLSTYEVQPYRSIHSLSDIVQLLQELNGANG
ncbi:putative hydrolase of the HAD superfamily [Paenibacillus castaneae]|uniref:HAD family hydrolase n=1 Tax=Paenibacillus castaneae TaxID=474957 RepID=UPI00141BC0EA|nr:HAD family hydrolase [Paenibacillus castaneae]NIK79092.1 putative hydrolase of the HAD superfamily [Paenibacillus castaneae]